MEAETQRNTLRIHQNIDRQPELIARSLNTREIFRQLIADEVRQGRLSSWRRRRIVRYATAMGLSAVEAGTLMATCREEVSRASAEVRKENSKPIRRKNSIVRQVGWIITLLAGTIFLDLVAIHWFF